MAAMREKRFMMDIVYKDKTMIITHPSGHVDVYDEVHMQKVKAIAEQDRDGAVQNIITLDNHITQVRSS